MHSYETKVFVTHTQNTFDLKYSGKLSDAVIRRGNHLILTRVRAFPIEPVGTALIRTVSRAHTGTIKLRCNTKGSQQNKQ